MTLTRPAAAYLRLSQSTDDSVSIAGQTSLVREEARKRGWLAPAIFTDEGVSGSKAVRRPARDELERRIDAGEFGALIVKSVDRLARSVVDFHRIADLCKRRDCHLVVTDLNLDTSTPIGAMVLGILAQIAAFEASIIGARVASANVEKISEGRALGGPVPYGFRNMRHQEKVGTYRVVDEDQAVVVRGMVDSLLTGRSLHAIAMRLHDEGTLPPRAANAVRKGIDPKPGAWDMSAVRRILRNPALAGMQRRRGDLVRDPATGLPRVDVAAILAVAEWKAVQAALDDREGPGFRRRLTLNERPLLDGLAVCGTCGKSLGRQSAKGTGTEPYLSYSCGRATSRCSDRASLKVETLEKHVVSTFLATVGRLPVVEAVESLDPRLAERLAHLRQEVAATLALMGTASPSEVPALAQRLVALRGAEDAARLEAESSPAVTFEPTGQTFAEALAETEDNIVARRALLARALVAVEVAPGRLPIEDKVHFVWDEGPNLDALDGESRGYRMTA